MSKLKLRLGLAAMLLAGASLAPGCAWAAPAPAVPAPARATGLPDFSDLVEKVGPAVVNIRTTVAAQAPIAETHGSLPPGVDHSDMADFFRRFFGIPLPDQIVPKRDAPDDGGDAQTAPSQPDQPGSSDDADGQQTRGVGSGFILSQDGYVMTNAHVVDDADSIYVTLTDNREFKAKLIGVDERTDVAILKIDADKLPTVEIGDSNHVRVGEWVVAIGSPFGLDNTVTAGIVSAKGRDTGDYLPFIQTDVAVNPGNSGGPLIDMQGQVIGINSQIYSRTGGFMGISFAIPIDEAMRVAEQLETTGHVVRGRIAVEIADVSPDVAAALGLPKAEGALVSNVEAGGPADAAGIQAGDIILRFDGRPVELGTDLQRMVGDTKPGTKAPVTVWRKGQTHDLQVTVVEVPVDAAAGAAQAHRSDPSAPRASNVLGLTVGELSADQLKTLKIKGGVQVVNADGPAARVGLRRGDVVLRIGANDVTSVAQFNTLCAQLDPQKTVPLLVRRGDLTQYVTIRPRAN